MSDEWKNDYQAVPMPNGDTCYLDMRPARSVQPSHWDWLDDFVGVLCVYPGIFLGYVLSLTGLGLGLYVLLT